MHLMSFCAYCGTELMEVRDVNGKILYWMCPECTPVESRMSGEDIAAMQGSARCPECGTDCLHIDAEDRSALCFWCGYESPSLTGEPTTAHCTVCGRMARHVARPGPLGVILVREGWRDTDTGWMCPSCLLRRIMEEEP